MLEGIFGKILLNTLGWNAHVGVYLFQKVNKVDGHLLVSKPSLLQIWVLVKVFLESFLETAIFLRIIYGDSKILKGRPRYNISSLPLLRGKENGSWDKVGPIYNCCSQMRCEGNPIFDWMKSRKKNTCKWAAWSSRWLDSINTWHQPLKKQSQPDSLVADCDLYQEHFEMILSTAPTFCRFQLQPLERDWPP